MKKKKKEGFFSKVKGFVSTSTSKIKDKYFSIQLENHKKAKEKAEVLFKELTKNKKNEIENRVSALKKEFHQKIKEINEKYNLKKQGNIDTLYQNKYSEYFHDSNELNKIVMDYENMLVKYQDIINMNINTRNMYVNEINEFSNSLEYDPSDIQHRMILDERYSRMKKIDRDNERIEIALEETNKKLYETKYAYEVQLKEDEAKWELNKDKIFNNIYHDIDSAYSLEIKRTMEGKIEEFNSKIEQVPFEVQKEIDEIKLKLDDEKEKVDYYEIKLTEEEIKLKKKK